MDFYNQALTQQLAPLVALALGDDAVAETLRRNFDRFALALPIWDNVIIKNRLLTARFLLNYHGASADIVSAIVRHKVKSKGTSSPLSPFNPKSDIFPNGVVSHEWFQKYTRDMPFAAVVVYRLPESSSGDDELGAALAGARAQFSGYGVKFVAVVVSDQDGSEDRIALLRRLSGLANLSGIFHLHAASDTLENDCDILTTSVVGAIKGAATDFYSAIEHRVRQRYGKYYTMPKFALETSIQLTPKTLESRNLIKQAVLLQLMHPHNIEGSLAVVELAYNNLLEMINENLSVLQMKSVSTHDTALFNQWRLLIDILAVHLIRGYFSIEQPVAALRKHNAHIATMSALLSSFPALDVSLWTAVQYQWLADLMTLLPESILAGFKKAAARTKDETPFSGGILFLDNSTITTDAALLFAKAAGLVPLTPVQSASYITKQLATPALLLDLRVRLLETARRDANDSTFGSYLAYQIAQCYMEAEKYTEAARFARVALASESETWSFAFQLITETLLVALAKLNDVQEFLKQAIRFATKGRKAMFPLPTISLGDGKAFSLDPDTATLEISASIFNDSLEEEIRSFDTLVTQLVVKPKLNTHSLLPLIPNTKVSLSVEKVDLIYSDQRTVLLYIEAANRGRVQREKVVDGKATFGLEIFDTEEIVLQLTEEVCQSGWLALESLKAHLTIVIDDNGKQITVSQEQVIQFDGLGLSHVMSVYDPSGIRSKSHRLKGRAPTRLFVAPYCPELSAKVSLPAESILVGEQLAFPVALLHGIMSEAKLRFSSVAIEIHAEAREEMNSCDSIHAQVNWEGLKDDEPLQVLDFLKGNELEKNLRFLVRIKTSPSSPITQGNGINVEFVIKAVATETSGQASSFELAKIRLPVRPLPFAASFSIQPRPFSETSPSIPNPFVLDPQSSDLSMPLPSRRWLLKQNLGGFAALRSVIEILQFDISLSAKNPGVQVDWMEPEQIGEDFVLRLFLTSSKHRFTTHNVVLVAASTIRYKRREGDIENTHYTEETELTIPLQDPRVFLEVKQSGAEQFCLRYVIENPTLRLLTFSTTLSTDKAILHGYSWVFNDDRNEVPLGPNVFPVLPFSEQELLFWGSCKAGHHELELPQLQVFDMNYKVSLPTLVTQDSVQPGELGLVMKVEAK